MSELGCCNKIPEAVWLIHIETISHSAGASGRRSGCQQSQGLVRVLLWAVGHLLLHLLGAGRALALFLFF